MKKILFVTNMGSGKIGNFSKASFEVAKELNMEFHIIANQGEGGKNTTSEAYFHHYDCSRNPLSLKNIKAYKQLLKLMKKEEFDIVHCNTPVGGLLGRICAQKTKVPKVIYTAHGFHFYKGAPLINNIVFKFIERIMAHWTDVIITMNKEDYEAAKNLKLKKGGKVYFVHGVGINLDEYSKININKNQKRKELRLLEDDIVLISMGDLIKRKNYSLALESIAKCNNKRIKYLVCGNGPELEKLKLQVKRLGIESQVSFLGFRTDIKELLKVADMFLFTSSQEGLPRSLMEAMASGLPCIVSNIRGNVDLLDNEKGGFLYNLYDINGFSNGIKKLYKDDELRVKMSEYNLKKIKEFDIKIVKKEIYNIYSEILNM